jgi:hypothetical protein
LVVGADGIHSRTRVEMQRFAEETGPKGLTNRDKSSKSMERRIWNDSSFLRDLILKVRASACH